MTWQKTLQRNRFVVLGRVGMDLYADPPGTRIEDATRFSTAIGGSAANIAVGLVRQGAAASLLTRVSDDAVGRFCLTQLAAYGVGTQAIRPAATPARNSLAIVETRAEDCQSVLYRSGAADLALAPEDVESVDFNGTGGLVVTGTALASASSSAAVALAVDRAGTAGALIIMDIDYRPSSWPSADVAANANRALAEKADIVIGNDEEFDLIAGSHGAGRSLARDLAQSGKAFVIYKMGSAGCVTYAADDAFRTGIAPVNALKPMGAGDGFMAGLLAGLAQGRPLAAAVENGAATAAMIVAGIGCAPASPTTAELAAFMATTPIRTGPDDAHSAF